MSDQEAWIQASLETLEELESERQRLERRLESENQPAAIRETSVRLEQLDLEIESLYATLEAAAEQMEEEEESPAKTKQDSKPVATSHPPSHQSVPVQAPHTPGSPSRSTPRSAPSSTLSPERALANGRAPHRNPATGLKPSIHEMDTKPTPTPAATQFYSRSSSPSPSARPDSQMWDDVQTKKSATEVYGSNRQMWSQSGVDAAARQALMSKWRAAKQNALEARGETRAPGNRSDLASMAKPAFDRDRPSVDSPMARSASRSTPTIAAPSNSHRPPPPPQYGRSNTPPPILSSVSRTSLYDDRKLSTGSVMQEVMDDDSGPTLVTPTPSRGASIPIQPTHSDQENSSNSASPARQPLSLQKSAPSTPSSRPPRDASESPAILTLQPEEAIAHAESIEAEIEAAITLVETMKKDELRWADEVRRANEATSAAEKMIADARDAQQRAERLVNEARARRASAIEAAKAKQAEAQAARAHVEQAKLIKRMTDELESEVWVAEAHLGKLQSENTGQAKIYSERSKVAMETAVEAEKIAEVKKAEADQAINIAERAREEVEKTRESERNTARQRATAIRAAQEAVSQAKAKLDTARKNPAEALRQRTAVTKATPAATGIPNGRTTTTRAKNQNRNGDIPVKRMPHTTLN